MRFIIIFIFFFSNAIAGEVPNLKNIVINEKLKKYDELTFLDVDNNQINLENYRGKLVLLNFWATWCAPCKREMPSLEKLDQKFPEIKVYPINMEPPNKLRVRDFLKDIGVVSLNTYFDPKLDLVKLFKMRGLPTSILIDKNGDEFGRVVGEIDFYSEEFINLLKKNI